MKAPLPLRGRNEGYESGMLFVTSLQMVGNKGAAEVQLGSCKISIHDASVCWFSSAAFEDATAGEMNYKIASRRQRTLMSQMRVDIIVLEQTQSKISNTETGPTRRLSYLWVIERFNGRLRIQVGSSRFRVSDYLASGYMMKSYLLRRFTPASSSIGLD